MSLTRGKLANLLGIGTETIRFYETKGLIPSPPRTDSGYRVYPQEIIDRIRFIKRAQQLGFSLGEVEELLSLLESDDFSRTNLRKRIEKKLLDIDEKILSLQQIRKKLKNLSTMCQNQKEGRNCPIRETLLPDTKANKERR